MSKSKLSALLSLILVFASGAVLGAFAYRLYSATPVLTTNAGGPPPRPNVADFRKRYTADLTKEVKLDGEELIIMKESDIMGVLEHSAAAKKVA